MRVNKVHVGTELQPFLQLVVGTYACADTLESAVFDDTVLVQITEAGIERTALVSSIGTNVVLLTKSVRISHVSPVIWLHVVNLTIQSQIAAADGCRRIDFSIHTDESLSFGNGKDVIRNIFQNLVVSPSPSISCRIALVKSLVVTQRVVSLHILLRCADHIVVLNGAAVGTPFHVNIDDGIVALAFLRGHEDDT